MIANPALTPVLKFSQLPHSKIKIRFKKNIATSPGIVHADMVNDK